MEGRLSKMKTLGLAILIACAFGGSARSEVVSVPAPASGGSGTSEPTQTFLWEGKDAAAVLIMIPGGEGHLGLTPAKKNIGGFYGSVLRPLTDPTMTSGHIHVVVFDSPDPLPVGSVYPTSRATQDHLDRIESVVKFYRKKYGKPVWLMGHSNGAISVAEFIGRRASLVNGAILSSSRVGVQVSTSITIPILFLHHKNDECAKADPRTTVDVFETLRSSGKKNTAFVWIDGGTPEAKSPCASGHHMYYGAGPEAFLAIDKFISEN